MKVVGFCGASGSGKTTLLEGVIATLKSRQQRVSVIKHAHEAFDIDHPGKDSWRHRQAGAFEVMVASSSRLAKVREFEVLGEPTIHQLIAEMVECDWLLFEGFKHADLPKIELQREALAAEALYVEDPFVVAIATDAPGALPVPTLRPLFGLTDAQAVVDYLLGSGDRFEYHGERHG
jgi:molybdopterin-guanine dinucleotide biosynthesis protein B